MTPVTLDSGEYLMVDRPEGFWCAHIEHKEYDVWHNEVKKHRSYDVLISYPEDGGGGTKCISHQVKLPDGKYIVVGIGNELTDEQWSGIVDRDFIIDENGESWRWFKNYEKGQEHNACEFETASGLSLIQHHGMKPNCVILKKQ